MNFTNGAKRALDQFVIAAMLAIGSTSMLVSVLVMVPSLNSIPTMLGVTSESSVLSGLVGIIAVSVALSFWDDRRKHGWVTNDKMAG